MVSGPAGPADSTVFKRSTAQGFYKLMRLIGTPVIDNHADFRLMSRPALDALSPVRGSRTSSSGGLSPSVGFKSGIVEYERHERFAGQSKYPLGKMLSFAFDGITSFSTPMPIRLITLAGFGIFVVSLLALLDLPGTEAAGLYCPGLGYPDGVHLAHRRPASCLALGILGEYVGKIYMEVKHRPRFVIERVLDDSAGGDTAGRPERLEITTAGAVRRDMIA